MALERIVAHKREEVAQRKAATPPDAFRAVPPSDRSLEEALRQPHTGFILECKKASPSRGQLRTAADPAEVARAYAPHADAISVLTDTTFFGGSFADLAAVRAVAPQPVLCKDFVVDPWQVREARHHGADAVLLMLSVLDDETYAACAREAADLSMNSLTEVHDEAELERALRLGARIIGINNRDLRTLAIDLDTVRRLAPLVPSDRLTICESGIITHAQVTELRPLADAFLVGSALMAAADLPAAVRLLVYGPTKVCGLTRPEDARAVLAAGATHGGLIFAEESPRRVTPARAAEVRAAADLHWVGVFVNAPSEDVATLARTLRLSAVQLHGEETADYIAALRPLLPEGCAVWKAVRVRDALPPLAATGADLLVLDGFAEGQRGGTGKRFDWSLLTSYPDRDRVFLGGGLTPDVAAAAAAVGTYGLDVNSGVESAPGVKDPDRLAAFFAARRGTGRTRKD